MTNITKNPRRIVEAACFDGAIGPITATELVAMGDDQWGILRDRLTDGSRGPGDGLTARCMQCGGRVFISTRVLGPARLPYFAHYKGGDPSCPWSHGPNLTPDAVKAAQFHGQQESVAHRMLCEQIDRLAKLDPRYIRSTVSTYLPPTENAFGRYPDVYVEWRDFPPFAVEIQLSNTFQTEISGRCLHYGREEIPLLWVLYGIDPGHGEMPQSFRDVIRRHRGNAFVLDREAIETSKAAQTLILKCRLKNGGADYDPPKLVRVDELTFPSRGLPYCEDRIVGPLCQRIDEIRRPWFRALQPLQGGWTWPVPKSPAIVDALAALG